MNSFLFRLILDREHKPRRSLTASFSRRLNDEGGNRAQYGLGEYHSYDHIITWMEEIQRLYPDKAQVINIGTTEEGRPIKGIKIGSGVHRTDKRIVWIDGGIHAREWAAVHTVIYIIDRLIADYETDPLVREAVDELNFYLFPVLNPDGYEYSRSGISPLIRLWRKNRSSMMCKKDYWFRERCCGGVDLNRNFDWFWGEIGSSSDRCSEIYQGKEAFSEAESRAVRDAMLSREMRGKVDAFLTLHTYSQMWIHPFSHQRKTVPEDISDIEQVGRKALNALENVYGTKYRFGTGADILYPSSGGSDDWAKGKIGAKYVYLMELRPSEEVWDGFILDSRQLIPTGRETWAGIKVVIQAVLNLKREMPSRSSAIAKSIVNASSLPSVTTSSNIATISKTTATLTTNKIDTMMNKLKSTLLYAQYSHNKSFSAPQFTSPITITYNSTMIPFVITTIATRHENLVRATSQPVIRVLQNGKRKWIRVLSQHTPARIIDMTTTSFTNIPMPRPLTPEPFFRDPNIQPNQVRLF
ncbi:zinc carboxypeptidase [Dictyocaulus viviparus]|uniref:Zinc carboxypeptidase n=1 Tax=Dictyocaulus viviparus TaxID=29172 RepID=A0A0D8YAM7_DICVI|nr:zinc carboxypeptidase [Dictyocaulus viviparus]